MNAAITRLEFHDLPLALREMLGPRVARLGYLGEFFKCAGHQPSVLAPFMAMTDALKTALPERLTELGALTVAVLMQNDYERHQHERLSLRLGFERTWIADAESLTPDAGTCTLSREERLVQRLIIATIERRGKDVASERGSVIDAIGEAATIAILFLVGRYVTHALLVNALELQPPVASIFADEDRT